VHIDWPTLVAVAVVAAGTAITVVLLVAFAFVGLSLRPQGQVDRLSGWDAGSRTTAGTVTAGFCLLAAGLIVCYGLYLIVT
jgi:UPF0716 family protein affecting phage T7 exclusion